MRYVFALRIIINVIIAIRSPRSIEEGGNPGTGVAGVIVVVSKVVVGVVSVVVGVVVNVVVGVVVSVVVGVVVSVVAVSGITV